MGKYFAVFASTHLSIPLLVKKKWALEKVLQELLDLILHENEGKLGNKIC